MQKQAGMLVISDPAEEVVLAFTTVSAKNLEDAVEQMAESLDGFVQNAELVTDGEEVKINGMSGHLLELRGTAGGKKVEVSVALIRRPNNQFLVLLGIVESSKLKKHEPTLGKIINSMKPF
jgi:hypothetical protein